MENQQSKVLWWFMALIGILYASSLSIIYSYIIYEIHQLRELTLLKSEYAMSLGLNKEDALDVKDKLRHIYQTLNTLERENLNQSRLCNCSTRQETQGKVP